MDSKPKELPKQKEPAFALHVVCETCGHQVSFLFNGQCEDCIKKYKPEQVGF